MKSRTHALLCLSAIFGLPLLIVGCADAVVEENTDTETTEEQQSEATETTNTEATESTGVEKLVVSDDGSIGHAAVAFEEAINSGEGIVLVDFWATWCGPCRMLAPELEKIASENPGKVTVVKVDVDQASELAQKYEVSSIPDVRVFKAGEQIDALIGFMPADKMKEKLGL